MPHRRLARCCWAIQALASVGYTLSGVGSNLLTMDYGGAGATITVTDGTHAINAPIVLNDNLTISNSGSLTVGGAIANGSNGPMGITVTSGNLVLGGSNTYSGGTTISGGTVTLAHRLAVQNSTVNVSAGGALCFAAGVINPTLGGLEGAGNVALVTVAAAPVTLNVGQNGQNTTYSGSLSGAGGLTKQGAGVLTLNASQSYSGPTVVSGGMLQLSGIITGTVAYNFDDGTLQGWSTVMSGAYSFLPMSTANNNGGMSAAQSGSYWVSDSDGVVGNRDSEGNTQFIRSPQFILGSGNLTFYLGGGSHAALPANASSVLASPNTSSSGYMGVALENVSTGAFVLTLAGAGDNSSWQAESFTQAQLAPYVGGTYTLDLINQYNGGWGWIALDTVSIPAGRRGGGNLLPVATPLSIAANATLDLGGGSQQVASLSDYATSNGGSIINSGTASSVLTLSPTGGSTTFSGMIQGGGTLGTISLVMSGSGTQVLAGSNTYTGPTTVSQGELVVNGSLLSPVTVNSGGILGGTGHLSSGTVSSGGQIAPGNSPQGLGFSGGLLLASGAEMDYELDTPTTSDEISCGSLLVSSPLGFSNFDFTWTANFGPGKYNLIEAGSLPGGVLGNSTSGVIDGLPANLAVQGNDVVLNVVPEPSTLALLGTGVLTLIGWVWRKRFGKVEKTRDGKVTFAALGLIALSGFAGSARGETLSPLELTGYNYDGIADPGQSTPVGNTTGTLKTFSDYFAKGFDAADPSVGLPAGSTFWSAFNSNTTFAIQLHFLTSNLNPPDTTGRPSWAFSESAPLRSPSPIALPCCLPVPSAWLAANGDDE